jgi:hypothetical protein
MTHNKEDTKETTTVETKGMGRRFPHENLVAYEVGRQAVKFIAVRRAKLRGLPGEAGPQLERAIVGAQTNLCAGAAVSGVEARRHFRIAVSEASEAGGALDIAYDFGAFDHDEYLTLRSILLRLGALLRGLTR